jgi:hypothetical protein
MSKTNNEKIEEIKKESTDFLSYIDSGEFDILILEKIGENLKKLLNVDILKISENGSDAKNISGTVKLYYDMYIQQRDYLKK